MRPWRRPRGTLEHRLDDRGGRRRPQADRAVLGGPRLGLRQPARAAPAAPPSSGSTTAETARRSAAGSCRDPRGPPARARPLARARARAGLGLGGHLALDPGRPAAPPRHGRRAAVRRRIVPWPVVAAGSGSGSAGTSRSASGDASSAASRTGPTRPSAAGSCRGRRAPRPVPAASAAGRSGLRGGLGLGLGGRRSRALARAAVGRAAQAQTPRRGARLGRRAAPPPPPPRRGGRGLGAARLGLRRLAVRTRAGRTAEILQYPMGLGSRSAADAGGAPRPAGLGAAAVRTPVRLGRQAPPHGLRRGRARARSRTARYLGDAVGAGADGAAATL